MSGEEDAWDADDFNPDAGFAKPSEGGEDEEWEGEDEGLVIENDKDQPKPKSGAVGSKKSKTERIEEKKAKRREEELKNKAKTQGNLDGADMTAEERLEEKRKAEEAQRQADLESAKELFGVSESGGGGGGGGGGGDSLDRMNPKTPEEFNDFASALTKKITQFEANVHYTTFLEGLFREVATPLDVEDLRRLSSAIGAMATEKQKLKQPQHKKKKGKVALSSVGKGARRVDMDGYDDDLGAEFDDFM